MKLFNLAAAVVITASMISTAGIAATKPAASVKKAAALTCPVTGETIASAKDAYDSEVYKGKTYYFCCAGCKPMFDKDPAKYIKPAATKAPAAPATPAK